MSAGKFSADRAAFFFIEKRADKGALRRLGFAYVLGRLIIIAMMVLVTLPFLINAAPTLLDMDPDSNAFLLKLQSVSNVYQAVGMLAGMVFLPIFVAIYAALLRWMIHGESGGKRLGLRFGEQELQVLVVLIAVTLVLVLAIIVSLIPLVIVAVVASVMAKAGGHQIIVAFGFILGFAWLCAIIWFSVRLSPAVALTVKRGKIQVFEAFAVSKGHFWSLFLAYVLQFFVILALALAVLFTALLVSLPFLGVGVAMFGWSEPSMTNVGAYIGLAAVPMLVLTITGLMVEYLRYAMGAGVSACLVSGIDMPKPGSAEGVSEAATPS